MFDAEAGAEEDKVNWLNVINGDRNIVIKISFLDTFNLFKFQIFKHDCLIYDR